MTQHWSTSAETGATNSQASDLEIHWRICNIASASPRERPVALECTHHMESGYIDSVLKTKKPCHVVASGCASISLGVTSSVGRHPELSHQQPFNCSRTVQFKSPPENMFFSMRPSPTAQHWLQGQTVATARARDHANDSRNNQPTLTNTAAPASVAPL